MSSTPRLARGEAHSWHVALDVPAGVVARLHATLASDERERGERFRFERDRRRFVVARGVLREVLGRYLRADPAQIRFAYNACGKPELSGEFGGRLRFNLSHSDEVALIAVAEGADVGVDVERVRAQPDAAEIARWFFTAAEAERLSRLPSHRRAEAFFRCWTGKEAYTKARGEGLAAALASLGPAAGWSLFHVQPVAGYVGALAIEGSGWRLTQLSW